MKFYDKTEYHNIFVTTHNAVMTAVNALNSGIDFDCFQQVF